MNLQDTPEVIRNNVVEVKRGEWDCWEWQRCKTPKGYGQAWFEGQRLYAHRLAYRLFNGNPDGKMVRHRCDNPPCCNPRHLLLGTTKDNSKDASERGLLAYGERNGMAKLTTSQVRIIKSMLQGGVEREEIAEQFGVTNHCIKSIAAGKRWGHIR